MNSGRVMPKEWLAYLKVGALVLLAAFPWVLGLSYSKGNDFFYWLHFGWWLGPHLLAGQLPDLTMLSGCGQAAFNLDHLPDAVGLALLISGFGIEGGIRLFVVFCYAIGGAGIFTLARQLCGNRAAALVAVAAYLLSWYLTRTADFYVYTSNLLQLVLLPWVVHWFRRSTGPRPMGPRLVSALLLTLCVLANPQTAIKVAGLASLWILLERSGQQPLGRHLVDRAKTLAVVGGITAWFSAFHIATALIHRREILTFGERGGRDPGAWKAFFYLPVLALEQLANWAGMEIDLGLPLKTVTNAHYWGVGVMLLGFLALAKRRNPARDRILLLWRLTGLGVLLFLAISLAKPTEWVGASRNMLLIPVFCGALLCGFGALRWVAWLRRRRLWRGWRALPLALVVLELGTIKVGFYWLGPHHVPLVQIPQVGFWQDLSANQPWGPADRFYTFQSDLAFMLFPALTGRATANRIHQRDYLDEFYRYEEDLNWHLSQPPPYGPVISEYLGLLNIRYLDVPQEGFSGRFEPHYAQILAHLAADSGLQELARRDSGPQDRQWNRYAALGSQPSPWPRQTGMPAQVAFANHRARFAFLAPRAVAIVGAAARQRFGELSFSPEYRFDRVLYLLCDDLRVLDGVEPALAGLVSAEPRGALVPAAGLRVLGSEELAAWYGTAADLPSPELVTFEDERLVFNVPVRAEDGFMHVALERFSDWHAYDGKGRNLRVFKAGAGMSAVFLPAGTDRVVMQYERPLYKSAWRYFSLIGLAAVVGYAMALRWRTEPGMTTSR